MKTAKIKTMFIIFILFLLVISISFAVISRLQTPNGFISTTGFTALSGACEATSENEYDGTTSWNITNATLYTNADGTWKPNGTLLTDHPNGSINSTYFFNFTTTNGTRDGNYFYNVQCSEVNLSSPAVSQQSFDTNRTIITQLAKPTVTLDTPGTNTIDLDGNDISASCTGQVSTGWNFTQVDFYTSLQGGENWTINDSFLNVNAGAGSPTVTANFTINKLGNASLADGTVYTVGCSFTQQINDTNGTDGNMNPGFAILSEKTTTNVTLLVEYPPETTLNSPANNNWSKNVKVKLNYTALTRHDGNTQLESRLWTNETGAWLPAAGARIATNNTPVIQDYIFQDLSDIVWGVQTNEQNNGAVINSSVNRTIKVDGTPPTISVSTADGAIFGSSSVTIIYTPSDNAQLNATEIRGNNSVAGFNDILSRNDSPTIGEEITIVIGPIDDGRFNISIKANDTALGEVVTSNITLIVDTLKPSIFGITNVSNEFSCTSRRFEWSTNETTNFTIFVDTDTDTGNGDIFTNSTKSFNHSFNVEFNESTELDHFINITSCDLAGNCNTSGQFTFVVPASVCSGWSQYAIYDQSITLGTIQNQSGAELVYVWNGTDQDWVFKTAGLTTNDDVIVGRLSNFPVVHLFENNGSTWLRNTTETGTYEFNITEINNWVPVSTDYIFGNFTQSFQNASKDFPSFIGNDTSHFPTDSFVFGPFNFTFFAGYNNTAQNYVNHLFNFTWANSTFLEPCPSRTVADTCMEAVWVASGFNVTWNGTAITRNYTA